MTKPRWVIADGSWQLDGTDLVLRYDQDQDNRQRYVDASPGWFLGRERIATNLFDAMERVEQSRRIS